MSNAERVARFWTGLLLAATGALIAAGPSRGVVNAVRQPFFNGVPGGRTVVGAGILIAGAMLILTSVDVLTRYRYATAYIGAGAAIVWGASAVYPAIVRPPQAYGSTTALAWAGIAGLIVWGCTPAGRWLGEKLSHVRQPPQRTRGR